MEKVIHMPEKFTVEQKEQIVIESFTVTGHSSFHPVPLHNASPCMCPLPTIEFIPLPALIPVRGEKIPQHTHITSPTEKKVPMGHMNQGRFISKPQGQFHATPHPYT